MNIRLLEPTPFICTEEQKSFLVDAKGITRTWLMEARGDLQYAVERAYYDNATRLVVFPPNQHRSLPTYCFNDEGVESTVRHLFEESFSRNCPYREAETQADLSCLDKKVEFGPLLRRLREAILKEVPDFPGTKEAFEQSETRSA